MWKYIIFAGVNGAGKSTLYQTNSQLFDMPRINMDEIVRKFGNWKNSQDVMAAGKIAVKRLREYIDEGVSFNQETTLCGKSIFRNIQLAKEAGYYIELYYVGVNSVEIAKERVRQRVLAGGHGIPEQDIEKRYKESLQNLKVVLPLCDLLALYDNTDVFVKIADFENGCCTGKISKTPIWANNIFGAEELKLLAGNETNAMKAIILDMYGVIVKQTGDGFVPYVQQTFPDLQSEEICKPWNKADKGELTSLEIWEALGFQGDLEKIEKEYLDTIELNDGFLDFIKTVRKKYKLAILSNDSSRWSRYLREKFNIDQYFDVISISGDLKIRKPDEHIYRLTIEKLAVKPEECLYIDDRRGYLEAARKVGMHTILFNSRNVPYEGDMVYHFEELLDRGL